jgi:hypothetical protein
MPRLVPNPIGDLMHPLQRIEAAVTSLAERLKPVEVLPSVHEELVEVNRTLGLVLEAIDGMRSDLASFHAAQLGEAVAPKRTRAAG